jgi:hypothetical protein
MVPVPQRETLLATARPTEVRAGKATACIYRRQPVFLRLAVGTHEQHRCGLGRLEREDQM